MRSLTPCWYYSYHWWKKLHHLYPICYCVSSGIWSFKHLTHRTWWGKILVCHQACWLRCRILLWLTQTRFIWCYWFETVHQCRPPNLSLSQSKFHLQVMKQRTCSGYHSDWKTKAVFPMEFGIYKLLWSLLSWNSNRISALILQIELSLYWLLLNS